MLGLKELLETRGFDPKPNRVKLVRHKDARFEIESLRADGWFEVYQQYQSKPVFDGCDQIIVFVGEDGPQSRFVGIYQVGTREPADNFPLPPECPYPDWASAGGVRYTLTKRAGFEELEDRLVIDWGKAALAWHQWFTSDRPVIEIRPRGRVLPPFRDYLRVLLTHGQLVQLIGNAEAHRDWFASLSAVGGVYLIINSVTGEQYVGSATGAGGIWQRWSAYAKNGHGGNVRLQALCTAEPSCPRAFNFSILETFSRTLSRAEALYLEAFFKRKLGTRAFGLNAN